LIRVWRGDAGTPGPCRAVEEGGFLLGGVGPCFDSGGDALRLQLLNVGLDIGLLRLRCPFARELAAYLAEERGRK
jgi:hypothetical protein